MNLKDFNLPKGVSVIGTNTFDSEKKLEEIHYCNEALLKIAKNFEKDDNLIQFEFSLGSDAYLYTVRRDWSDCFYFSKKGNEFPFCSIKRDEVEFYYTRGYHGGKDYLEFCSRLLRERNK